MTELKVGMPAPNFTLPDQMGKIHSLSDFRGKKVVLYFYPKDNSAGCTRQAIGFRDLYEEYMRLAVEIIGISKDSEKSHQKFIESHALPFLLLSDPELNVIKAYDVWKEKNLYGKVTMGIVRTTFIIDEDGIIIKIFQKANANTNAKEVLEYLQSIR
ncbi:MAG TPA: thioredoxin-dependent thiol peroxidase [Flexilinea sp.]|jgi:peroxiredoxin Q/BCP|nr:thioredoxin-dependent thiol peroxidase [Flexilinea sp.]OQA24993.1 MAG: putative peroxiredoxin bcp [Chloroflexi bacterium ADurb.Bin344]HNY94756.1 thioredoxin-dependent thiol peroxidase [Flexilinea sp.]HOP01587.1 thioredoxin-dependent thiol peroxidase [Flexilinea sp.]HOR55079.1 thioredoxin-dependent thiol peroxidase [Flexilinea sp.]